MYIRVYIYLYLSLSLYIYIYIYIYSIHAYAYIYTCIHKQKARSVQTIVRIPARGIPQSQSWQLGAPCHYFHYVSSYLSLLLLSLFSLSLSIYIYIYHPIHVNIYRCTYAFLSDRADLPPVAITFRIIQLPSSSCHYFPNNSVAFLQLPLLSSSCLPPVAIIFLQLPSSSCHYFPPVAFLQLPLSSSNIYNPTEYTLFSILSDIIWYDIIVPGLSDVKPQRPTAQSMIWYNSPRSLRRIPSEYTLFSILSDRADLPPVACRDHGLEELRLVVLYIYIYIYIYEQTNKYIYIYIYIYICYHTCISLSLYIYIYIHIFIVRLLLSFLFCPFYVYRCMYCMIFIVYSCRPINIYIYIYTHTYVYLQLLTLLLLLLLCVYVRINLYDIILGYIIFWPSCRPFRPHFMTSSSVSRIRADV